MKAYLEPYRNFDEFRTAGVPMTLEEYQGEVMKLFSSPIARNEIHKLLNEAAVVLVKSTKTLEETAARRGELVFGEKLLALSEPKKKPVTVQE